MGCVHVTAGCANCYAEALTKRYGRDLWGKNADRQVTSDAYWRQPLKWNAAAAAAGVPAKVFCASLADVFERHPQVVEARARLWRLVAETPWLVWLFLTKRPEDIAELVPPEWLLPGGWPPNVWVGATVEEQRVAEQRVRPLLAVPAPVRFLSCEPLLGPVSLLPYLHDGSCDYGYDAVCTCPETAARVEWVIAGGESGPGARPMHPGWARALRDQAQAAGVPFLFKQWGDFTEVAVIDARPGDVWRLGDPRHQPSPWRPDTPPQAGAEPGRWDEFGDVLMRRVGKKAAGNALDGRTHDETPPLPVPAGSQ